VIIGLQRLGKGAPYQGLQRWHHVTGLIFAPFLLCWIFSGFLSIDDRKLFAHCDALFRALHTLDFEPLSSYPGLRAGVIVALCLWDLRSASPAWWRVRAGLNRTGCEVSLARLG
jgi:hypothetical protein